MTKIKSLIEKKMEEKEQYILDAMAIPINISRKLLGLSYNDLYIRVIDKIDENGDNISLTVFRMALQDHTTFPKYKRIGLQKRTKIIHYLNNIFSLEDIIYKLRKEIEVKNKQAIKISKEIEDGLYDNNRTKSHQELLIDKSINLNPTLMSELDRLCSDIDCNEG